MTGRRTQMAGLTFRGWVPDTDPRYDGGSTIIVGPNLNPHFVSKSEDQKPSVAPVPKPQRKVKKPPAP
jgi:hypothetical protein